MVIIYISNTKTKEEKIEINSVPHFSELNILRVLTKYINLYKNSYGINVENFPSQNYSA